MDFENSWDGKRERVPGDLVDSEIEPRSPALQVDSSPSEPPGKSPKSTLEINLDSVCLEISKITARFDDSPGRLIDSPCSGPHGCDPLQ